jgi:hypothetical protein
MSGLPDPFPLTVMAIYEAYEAERDDAERTYLGASALGSDCDRALWLNFRWVSPPETFDGRKLRLFATGHREEDRMVEDLRRAGIHVDAVDPTTGTQWGVQALGGHFRGHLDGIVLGIPEAPETKHVLECKTHSDKSFRDLVKKGVQTSKPAHWRQMQAYMHLRGLTRALYMAHNKNTDDLHVERVDYDAPGALEIMARAQRVIQAVEPAGKVNDTGAYPCTLCQHAPVCHSGAWPRTNCRTCLHATPIDGGWRCERHEADLDVPTQRVGCPHHLFIPALIPGEQVDADSTAETVTYRLPDGSTWVDGRSA